MTTFIQNLIDGLSLGSIYALVALGIGLLFGILRLINFAHGDFITLGAYALIVPSADAAAKVLLGALPWVALVPVLCILVAVAALLVDALFFRPLRKASASTLMIASFAVSYILQNGILLIYGGRPKALNIGSELNVQLEIGDLRIPLLQVVTLGVTITLMVCLAYFLNRTKYGIQMRAAAEDFKMAQYLGVNANFVIGLAFFLSGMLAAVVSLLFTMQSGVLSHTMGVPLALFAFVAVVVGGMGSLQGAVVGGFVIGMTVIMLQAYLPPDLRPFRDAFTFSIVIAILLWRPQGIVPSSTSVERV